MSKKTIAICLFFITIISVSFASAVGFNDVDSSHWAYETILEMQEKGLIKGYDGNLFKPEKEVTREEFAQMVYMAKNEEKVGTELLQDYFDVPQTRWSYNAVQLVGNSLKETADGYVYFYPTRPIQRQEVAQIVSDLINEKQSGKNGYMIDRFSDSNSINSYYIDAVENVYELGLMKGVSEDTFSPESSLTRAQAATMISRILDKLNPEQEPVEPKVESSSLDFDFIKLENKKENLIYSPLSIKYAMSMLNDGANGKTKEEIENILGKNTSLTKYENIEKVLSLANSIFIRDTYKEYIKDTFIKAVQDKYNAEVLYDQFKDATNPNKWIEDKTFGIIKNMLKDELVQDETLEMLLINALAIDMEWENGFSDTNTRGAEFTKDNGEKVQATTMQKETSSDNVMFYKGEDITALSMNLKKYGDTQLEFLAIMPNENLAEYANRFTNKDLEDVTMKLIPASKAKYGINIFLPRFEYSYDLSLKEDLKKLGMELAFNKYDADFTEMTSNPVGLYVGEALHKADIKFSEKGIKAAAVTVFAMLDKASVMIEIRIPEIVKFDKPFMYVIRDKKTGEIWFVGTMYEPNLWENDKAEYEAKF